MFMERSLKGSRVDLVVKIVSASGFAQNLRMWSLAWNMYAKGKKKGGHGIHSCSWKI